MINISVFLIEQYKDNVSSLRVENSNLHLRTIKSQQKFIFSKHVVESVRKHMSLLLSGLLVQSERRLMSYIETQGQTTATQGCQRGKSKAFMCVAWLFPYITVWIQDIIYVAGRVSVGVLTV